MWATIAATTVGAILKAVPWETIFALVFKAILTNERARKSFINFVANVDKKVPITMMEDYEEQKKKLREKIEEVKRNDSNDPSLS
jgi:hypothetical protein